jgi:hypothetical protein
MPIKSQGGVHFINAADKRAMANTAARLQLISVLN